MGTKWAQSIREALRVSDVARQLKVSTATVYSLCARGELEHFRVLNSIRIPQAAVDALLAQTRGGETRRRRTRVVTTLPAEGAATAANDNEGGPDDA